MKKRSFVIGASILAIGGFLAKILGAFYKIPLTHILGANGMGIYYLVFPFYSLSLIIASSGISVAVTRLVAVEREKYNKRTEQKVLKLALIMALGIALILVVFTICMAKPFSFLQGNANAQISYIAIAPAIVFASIVAVMKGYFQGVENMMPSSISLIIQQGTRLVVGLFFAHQFMSYGMSYAVLGAIIGVTVSEFVAMCYLGIRYIRYKQNEFYNFFEKRKDLNREKLKELKCDICNQSKKNCYVLCKYNSCNNHNNLSPNIYYSNNKDCISNREVLLKLVRYMIPSTLANLVLPLAVFVDSFLVVNLLTDSGFTTSIATSLYGMSNGIVSSLISLPTIIISAVSTSIVPNLSSSIELNSRDVVISKTNFFIKFAWLISLPMAVMFLLFSPEIIELLYGGGLTNKVIDEFDYSYRILAVSSISIIYNSFLYTFTAILNAFDKPHVPFYSQCVGLVARTGLTFLLVSNPQFNVFGLLIANIVFLTISCIGCVVKIKEIVPLNLSIRRFFIVPIFSIVFVGCLGYAIKKVSIGLLPIWLQLGMIGGIMILMYVLFLLVLRTFTIKEWEYLPIPKRILKYLPQKTKKITNKSSEI